MFDRHGFYQPPVLVIIILVIFKDRVGPLDRVFSSLITFAITDSILIGHYTHYVACVAGVQRGGRGEVECEREARSLGARREQ